MATRIDGEIKRIVDECYAKARQMIREHEDVLHRCAELLLEKEKSTVMSSRRYLRKKL